NNELESYLDGRSRKIIVASIHRFIAGRLAAEREVTAPQTRRRRGRPRKHVAGGGAAPWANLAQLHVLAAGGKRPDLPGSRMRARKSCALGACSTKAFRLSVSGPR